LGHGKLISKWGEGNTGGRGIFLAVENVSISRGEKVAEATRKAPWAASNDQMKKAEENEKAPPPEGSTKSLGFESKSLQLIRFRIEASRGDHPIQKGPKSLPKQRAICRSKAPDSVTDPQRRVCERVYELGEAVSTRGRSKKEEHQPARLPCAAGRL